MSNCRNLHIPVALSPQMRQLLTEMQDPVVEAGLSSIFISNGTTIGDEAEEDAPTVPPPSSPPSFSMAAVLRRVFVVLGRGGAAAEGASIGNRETSARKDAGDVGIRLISVATSDPGDGKAH